MNDSHFDLVVFGTGPSGSTIARKVAKAGKRVAIIESRAFGGTCALRGCNPKKVYSNAGKLVDEVRRARGQLIHNAEVAIDWAELHAFKEEFVQPVREKSQKSFEDDGVTTLLGDARFVAEDELQLGERTLTADKFVIATGARPRPLDFPGAEHVTHSDAFFDKQTMPPHVAFIGGGYISMEFAHVVARYGSEVVVIEKNDRILRGFDPQLVDMLQEYSQEQGIAFRFDTTVKKIEPAGNALTIAFDDGKQLQTDLIVHGAGRMPNLDGLDLDAANIQYDARGVAVNEFMQSETNPRVYAAGDCAAKDAPPLTPTANEEARAIVKQLLGQRDQMAPDYGPHHSAVPRVAFTTPSIAAIGMLEEQARQLGRDIDVKFQDATTTGTVRKTGRVVAARKVIVERGTGKVLGAHLLSPAAEETINLFALAMKHDLTTRDIKSTLMAFPTFSSEVRSFL